MIGVPHRLPLPSLPTGLVRGARPPVSLSTSPHGPTNPLIFKDGNHHPPVQISRIDGERPLFRGLCRINLNSRLVDLVVS